MKICIVCGYYPLIKGGAEYQSRIIADQLSRLHEVFYISYGHPEEKEIIENGIKIYCIKRHGIFDNYSFFIFSALKIREILSSEAPQIIYNRVLSPHSFYLSNYARLHNTIKLFIHIADMKGFDFNLTLRGVIKYLCFKGVRRNYKKTNVIQFIVQTNEQLHVLEKYAVVPLLKINNMHPPGSDDYIPKKNTEPYKVVWIGAGAAREVKQLDVFIELAKKHADDIRFSFVIIGKLDNSKHGRYIRSRIEDTKNIVYMGEKTNDFINDYLKNVFVLVNTSLMEGFPNTYIQAWLTGTPVIALHSDPDGCIRKNNLGYYCESDFNKMGYYLDKLAGDPHLYAGLSLNSFVFAKNNFSIDANMKLLRDVMFSEKEIH